MKLSHHFLAVVTTLGFTAIRAEPLVSIDRTRVTYHGTLSDSVEHFQNVKFAHETSGKRRFAPPEPYIPPKNAIIDAKSPGSACPQHQAAMPPFFDETTDMSEDCLNLRISRPAGLDLTRESKLPVVVWIHGGGVVKGSAYDSHTDPHNLVKLSFTDGKPIIFTAINYRLSIFGFARLPILKDQKSLNVGMRDQRLALEWIKRNIRDFGGDPDRITVYGLSAGGTSISLQTMAYGGEEGVPFQQAWMMSGPPGTALNLTSEATTIHTTAVGEELGCVDSEVLDCLRSIPMQKLLRTALQYSIANFPPAGLFTFVPSVDGDFLPDSQSNMVREGRFVKGIRMIIGWTQDDGATNVGPGHMIQTEEDMSGSLKKYSRVLTADQISHLFSLYPSVSFQDELDNYQARKAPQDPEISIQFFRLSRIVRDLLFTCSSIAFGYEMVKQTRAMIDPGFNAVHFYSLNQTVLSPIFQGAGMPYVGVAHGSDTNYIFNGVFPEGEMSSEDKDLSEKFSRTLINFAYIGDPISKDSHTENQFDAWPKAFMGGTTLPKLDSFSLQVIGGSFGTGSVMVTENFYKNEYEDIGDIRPHLDPQRILKYGSFNGTATLSESELVRLVLEENLLERCAYIENLSETLGL